MRSPRRRSARLSEPTRFFVRQGLIGLAVVLGIGTLLTGVWYGTRLEAVTIQKVQVTGGDTLDTEAMAAIVEEKLEGTYVRLIPRRFSWLYPETDIIETIHDQFDRIDTLVIEQERTEVRMTVTEYEAAALWCEEAAEAGCLFLDDAGYAFATAPQLSGGILTRYVTTDRAPAIGSFVSDPSTIPVVTWFGERLQTVLGMYPTEVLLYPDGRATFNLTRDRTLLLNLRYDITESFRYLETLLASEEYRHLLEDDFQYIDLRFGNKLFVNQTEPELPNATSTEDGTEWAGSTPEPDGDGSVVAGAATSSNSSNSTATPAAPADTDVSITASDNDATTSAATATAAEDDGADDTATDTADQSAAPNDSDSDPDAETAE